MYYNDPGRRLTVLSGLTLGALLGAGLALLAGPAREFSALPALRGHRRRMRRLRRGAGQLGEEVREALGEALRHGREHGRERRGE